MNLKICRKGKGRNGNPISSEVAFKPWKGWEGGVGGGGNSRTQLLYCTFYTVTKLLRTNYYSFTVHIWTIAYTKRETALSILKQSSTALSPSLYPEVGTHYFFRSLLLLVRYLEIVLPLRAGRQLLKFGSSLALLSYSATAIIFAVRCH